MSEDGAAVPAQCGGFERLAAHRFHRIAQNRFNVSNLDRCFRLIRPARYGAREPDVTPSSAPPPLSDGPIPRVAVLPGVRHQIVHSFAVLMDVTNSPADRVATEVEPR